jgi:hypothetical protein
MVLNIRGMDSAGTGAQVLAAAALLPFILMCLIGLPRADPYALAVNPPPGQMIDYGGFLALMLWNFSGLDGAGTFASDVGFLPFEFIFAL